MKKLLYVLFIATMSLPIISFSQGRQISDSAKAIVQARINLINQKIKEKGYRWKAGITPNSYLTNEETRRWFGHPNDTSKWQNVMQNKNNTYEQYEAKKETGLSKTTVVPNWIGMMGRVKNQGGCGNCWAHASAGVAIGLLHNYIGSNIGIDLDEMDITNNDRCGDGCDGTIWLHCGLNYIQSSKCRSAQGINSYPIFNNAYYSVSTCTSQRSSNANIIAALPYSPVVAQMKVYEDFWYDYTGGIYEHTYGDEVGNHAIVIVSYDDVNQCWICKNSWNLGWGEREPGQPIFTSPPAQGADVKDYFRIAYGECQIELSTSEIVTATVTAPDCFAKITPNLQTFQNAMSSSWVENEQAYVLGNATVNTGETVTIPSNKNISFMNGSSLSVNGTLNANGESFSTQITFDFISRSYPSGIKYNTGSSGSLSYCTIKNAYTGIYCNGCLPAIQNCTITNNYTGLYFYNAGSSSNAIAYNTIQNNTEKGIYMYNSSPGNVHHNTISNSGQWGIYCTNYSAPYLRYNTITNNGSSGVCCVLYSPVFFSDRNRSPGYNIITQNYYGVIGGMESHVRIGSSTYGGYNNISNNTSYEVKSDYDSHIMAEYNWWNVSTYPYYNPSDFSTSYSGTIDYDPALSSNPLSKAVSIGGAEAIAKSIPFFDSELNEALDKMLDRKYEDALDIYTKRLKKENDVKKKRYILTCIAECYSESEKKDFIQYLDNNVRKSIIKSDEMYAVTLELENMLYMKSGNYSKALENLKSLKSGFTENSEVYKRALYGLVHLTHSYNKDNVAAKSYLNELKEKYPNDLLTRDAMFLLGNVDSSKTLPQSEEEIIIAKGSINIKETFECYPNPFNPSTVISFQVSSLSNVTLKVYDILGREVAELVNSIKDIGYYNATFAASNLSSGIYFARLTVTPLNGIKSTIQAKKMLLTK